jgi:membrane protein implicated in regulation of membrane protease activity
MNANLLGLVWYLAFIVTILLIFLVVPLARRLRQRIREHDERALYNRQIKAIRDREDRDADRRADNAAAWHRKLRGGA